VPPLRAGGLTGAAGLAGAAALGTVTVLLRGCSGRGEGVRMGVVPVDGGGELGTGPLKAAAARPRR